MAIEMVRIPSETPNISNTDDFVGLRYAYGNQSGYVIRKGFECSYNINGSTFIIHDGRLVLQGVECDIDANGVEITVDNIATKRYYSIYLQINLALNEVKILATYDTATYPVINRGDDLTQSPTGTARMELYRFDAINGEISNVNKTVKKIEYTENVIVKKAKNLVGIDYDLRQYRELLPSTQFFFGQGIVHIFNYPLQINPSTDSIVIRCSTRGRGDLEYIYKIGLGYQGELDIYDYYMNADHKVVFLEHILVIAMTSSDISVACNTYGLEDGKYTKIEVGPVLSIYQMIEGRIEE